MKVYLQIIKVEHKCWTYFFSATLLSIFCIWRFLTLIFSFLICLRNSMISTTWYPPRCLFLLLFDLLQDVSPSLLSFIQRPFFLFIFLDIHLLRFLCALQCLSQFNYSCVFSLYFLVPSLNLIWQLRYTFFKLDWINL